MNLNNHFNIITNHPGQNESSTWRNISTYIPKKNSSLFADITTAFKMIVRCWRFDCVVLGAGRSDMLYGLIIGFLPVRKPPCVKIDCLWYRSNSSFRAFMKKAVMRIADKAIDRYVVWARHEIRGYSREFGLPEDKFVFIPYHTTLETVHFQVKDDGYIFSGGNFARDYKTLIDAVRGLPVHLLIACTRPEIFKDIEIPVNVEVKGFSHEEYIKKMAACRINIVPLASGLLHSGGQQTFLNSMFMKKPTIVTDPQGGADYIDDNVDGILTQPGDAPALRKAILALCKDPQKARQIGENAGRKVQGYSTEAHFKEIAKLAWDVVNHKREQSLSAGVS